MCSTTLFNIERCWKKNNAHITRWKWYRARRASYLPHRTSVKKKSHVINTTHSLKETFPRLFQSYQYFIVATKVSLNWLLSFAGSRYIKTVSVFCSLISIVLLALHQCKCIKAKHAFAEQVTPHRSSAASALHRVQTHETKREVGSEMGVWCGHLIAAYHWWRVVQLLIRDAVTS
jgi:hypothetical protein